MLPCIIYNYLTKTQIPQERKKAVIEGEAKAIMSSFYAGVNLTTYDYSPAVENHISVTSKVINQVQRMCAQRIFILFDALSSWLPKDPRTSPGMDGLVSLLESIEKISLANMAYGCKAYARALKYFEQHLKCLQDRNELSYNLSNCLPTLQRIYIALGEANGVVGITDISETETTLSDRICDHEAKNRLQDALPCCEKGLKANPDSLEYAKKMVRCLMSLAKSTIDLTSP